MELTKNETLQCLEELQIPEEMCGRCREFTEKQQYEELYRDLRSMRGKLLEELHTAQARLDSLDRLIYDIKKKKEI